MLLTHSLISNSFIQPWMHRSPFHPHTAAIHITHARRLYTHRSHPQQSFQYDYTEHISGGPHGLAAPDLSVHFFPSVDQDSRFELHLCRFVLIV